MTLMPSWEHCQNPSANHFIYVFALAPCVNWETQVSLKRLNQIHFTERARQIKKKNKPLHAKFVNVIANMKAKETKNPSKKQKKEYKVKKEDVEGEKLLETPKKEDEEDLHVYLDKYEKSLEDISGIV